MSQLPNTRAAPTPGRGSGLIFFGLVLVSLSMLAGPILDRMWPVREQLQTQQVQIVGPVSTGGTFSILPYNDKPFQVEATVKQAR